MTFDSDDIYSEEIVREKARLDERERRDRIAKEAARQLEKKKLRGKLIRGWSLVTFGSYMAYKALMLFFE